MEIGKYIQKRNTAARENAVRADKAEAAIQTVVSKMDDKDVSKYTEILSGRKGDGSLIRGGTYIVEDGVVYRAAADLWDTEENSPSNAPTLWHKVLYRDGYRILEGAIESTNVVMKGEICWVGDVKWRSLIDNNVWLPADYPAGWESVED